MFAPAYPLVSGPFLVVSLRGPRLGRFAFPVLGFSASPRACRVCSGLCTSSSPVPRFRFRLRAAPSPCVPVLRTLYSVFKDLIVCLPTAFLYFYYTALISKSQALFLSKCDYSQRKSAKVNPKKRDFLTRLCVALIAFQVIFARQYPYITSPIENASDSL